MKTLDLDQAQTIYLVSTPYGARYIRAESVQAARVRAYKVWGVGRTVVGEIGNQAPDIGAHGYRIASGTMDIMPTKAAHADHVPALRGFYQPSQAKRTRVDNEAARLLALLG